MIYTGSKRTSRQNNDEDVQTKKKKRNNPVTQQMLSYSGSYTLKSYTGGTFKTACVGIHTSGIVERSAERQIADTVYTVQVVNRLVQQAIGYLLETAENLQLDIEHLVARGAASAGGKTILEVMHRYFYRRLGGYYATPPRESVSSVKSILDALFQYLYLGDFIDSARFVNRMYDQTIWEESSKFLDSSLAAIIVGQIDQLQEDVLDHYKGDPEEQSIRLQVEAHGLAIRANAGGGRVLRFLNLSSLLPRTKRRRMFPTSSSGNLGYVCLTEMNLFRMLARDTHRVTLSNVVFEEEDIKLRKGLFLYTLLSFSPEGLAAVNTNDSPTQWKTKTGALRKFVFLHQVVGLPYSKFLLFGNVKTDSS
jgi:hypothetical protein